MTRPELDISVRHDAEETVVALDGEIDIGTVPRLVATVEEALADAEAPRLVLDMGKVTFCDSQGLGTLVILNRAAARSRSVLVFANVGSFLRRLLDVTGLAQSFVIREDQSPSAVRPAEPPTA